MIKSIKSIFNSHDECLNEINRLRSLLSRQTPRPKVIPQELARSNQWVIWAYRVNKQENGMFRVIKQPYQPKNPYSVVSKSHSSELSDLSNALLCLKEYSHVDGIGYMFGEGDGLVGVDLDNCRDPSTGKIREEYLFWVKKLGSYAEISPSGTGVKIWVKGSVSDIYFASTESTGFRILNYAGGEIEIYRRGQFFTVTTQIIEGLHYNYIRNTQEDLDVICEFSLSNTDQNFTYHPYPEDQLEEDEELSLLKDFWDDIVLAYTDESDVQLNASTETLIYSPTNHEKVLSVSKNRWGDTSCNRCGRQSNGYELCPVCYAAGNPEEKVEDAVEEYLLQYPGCRVERQYEITIGRYKPKPDIVLLDIKDNIKVIVECKREDTVYYGIEQLKSYLSASDTQFGIFANSIEPDNWKFYENLRRHRFKEISRSQFETEIATDQSVETIREQKDTLGSEILELNKQISELNVENVKIKCDIESSNRELLTLRNQIDNEQMINNDLKEHNNRLTKKNEDLTIKIRKNAKLLKVQESFKLASIRETLESEVHKLSCQKDDLQNDIGNKKRQRCELSEKIDSLINQERQYQKKQSKIKDDRAKLKKEQQTWRIHRINRKAAKAELENEIAQLGQDIKKKRLAIKDLSRLSWLEEIEKTFSENNIYGQQQEVFERLRKLSLEIEVKQRLARENQQEHAAVERKRVEINQKKHLLVQISQERETILKKLARVAKRQKTVNPEKMKQIEWHRKQLVENLREVKQSHVNLFTEIQKLQEDESNLEHEIDEKEHGSLCLDKLPTYLRIQEEIDKMKEEKHELEVDIGQRVFRIYTDIKLKFTVQKSKEN